MESKIQEWRDQGLLNFPDWNTGMNFTQTIQWAKASECVKTAGFASDDWAQNCFYMAICGDFIGAEFMLRKISANDNPRIVTCEILEKIIQGRDTTPGYSSLAEEIRKGK